MRLVVTGASGLLGLNLSLVAANQGHSVIGLVNNRLLQGTPFVVKSLDLLAGKTALEVVSQSEPNAIIHCAAIADLNSAEKSPELAQRLNAEVPGLLAGAAADWGVPFLHISTDAVFDGRKGGYEETDPPNPLSVYAKTKLAGEQAVLAANPAAVVARVVFFGWSLSGKRSLSEFFFNNLCAGRPVEGFVDATFCPLYVEDLAEALLEIIDKDLHGVYHVVSPEYLSKYDFGVRLARKFGLNPNLIEPVQMAELQRGAPRSLNLTLKSDKVQAALGRCLPKVDEGLERLYQRWKTGYPQRLQGFAFE